MYRMSRQSSERSGRCVAEILDGRSSLSMQRLSCSTEVKLTTHGKRATCGGYFAHPFPFFKRMGEVDTVLLYLLKKGGSGLGRGP